MTTTGSQKPRRRLTASERRAQIIAASREVFLRSGLAGARVRELSNAADVNEALLYRHFESKEALFEAAVAEPLEAAVQDLISRGQVDSLTYLGSAPLRRERLGELLGELLDLMVELGPLLGVMFFADPERGGTFYRERFIPALDALAQAVEVGVDGGTWEHRNFDARLVVLSALATCLVLGLDERFGGGLLTDRERVIRELSDNILLGLERRED